MSDTDIQAVDTPAPDANVPETEVTETPAESSPAKAESKPDEAVDKVRSRIDELTKYRREAERDRDYWREQAMRAQQPPQPKVTEPEAVSDKPKTLADFEFDEGKYQSYLFEQAEKRAVAAAERRLKEQQETERASRRKNEFERREGDFAKSVEDYHEVTRNPAVPITSHMAEVIAESEDGPALAYYLGKNVAVAERIAQLSPLAAAREMGRIEAKLAAERDRAKEKPVSKAPPPTPQIEAGNAEVEKDPDQMSIEEWKKWRAKRDRIANLRK